MVGLTAALVFVGLVQAAVGFTALFESSFETKGLLKAIIVELFLFGIIAIVLWQTRSFWKKFIPKD